MLGLYTILLTYTDTQEADVIIGIIVHLSVVYSANDKLAATYSSICAS